jgi:hypothetical protein
MEVKMNVGMTMVAAVALTVSVASASVHPKFDSDNEVRDVQRTSVGSRVQGLDGDEFLIDTCGVHWEGEPAAAFDGTNFLVVWADQRNGLVDVYGARVDPSGQVLDPTGIAICTEAHVQDYPAVAFDGANFLVVWEDYREGSGFTDIYGARVNPAGHVLDTAGIPISTWLRCRPPAVAFDANEFLVVWGDGRLGEDIYGTNVDMTGHVYPLDGIRIDTSARTQCYPAVAFDGANFLVVWQDYRNYDTTDIYAARVNHDGEVLDPRGFPVSAAAGYQGSPRVASDGANSLVVWTDGQSAYDVYGARVSRAGQVLDTAGIPIAIGANDQLANDVAFDGADFLVVWTENCGGNSRLDIYGARVSSSGAVMDIFPVVSEDSIQEDAGLARGPGNQMFVVYVGWAGDVGGKVYNMYRIWGKLLQLVGLREPQVPRASSQSACPTFIHGVLFIPETLDSKFKAPCLLDAAGCRVLYLHAGANDVSRFGAGVYFVRDLGPGGRARGEVRKVVIAR